MIVAVEFPEGSEMGDERCVEVVALRDSFVEGTESLVLAIFEIDDNPSFQIDMTRMVIPFFILDSEKTISCLLLHFKALIVAYIIVGN